MISDLGVAVDRSSRYIRKRIQTSSRCGPLSADHLGMFFLAYDIILNGFHFPKYSSRNKKCRQCKVFDSTLCDVAPVNSLQRMIEFDSYFMLLATFSFLPRVNRSLIAFHLRILLLLIDTGHCVCEIFKPKMDCLLLFLYINIFKLHCYVTDSTSGRTKRSLFP